MMRVVALRGVCVGPERHLAAGEEADLDKSTADYLVSIKAVEKIDQLPTPEPAKVAGKKEK